eukprot:TCONS_00061502-protein
MDSLTGKRKLMVGLVCSVGYGFLYMVSNAIYQYVYKNSQVGQSEAMLLRFITGLVAVGSNLLTDGKRPIPKNKTDICFLLIAAVFRIGGALLTNLSLRYVDLGTIAVIAATSPALSIIMSWIFLKEKTRLSDILLGLASYVGVVLIVWNRLSAVKPNPYLYVIGVVFSFMSIFAYSFCNVLTRKMVGKTDFRQSLFVINFVGVIIFAFSPLVFDADFVLTRSPLEYCYLVLAGAMVCLIALLMEVLSLKCLNVGIVLLFRNTEFLWAYLHDVIFDNLYPTPAIILGLLIVMLSISLIAVNLMKDIPYSQIARKGWRKVTMCVR